MPEPKYVLDHVGIEVRDFEASRSFYERTLEPLGFSVIMDFSEYSAVGLGLPGKPSFWIRQGEPSGPAHVAFHAPDRERVDAFHAAALAAGGTDNGPAGVR